MEILEGLRIRVDELGARPLGQVQPAGGISHKKNVPMLDKWLAVRKVLNSRDFNNAFSHDADRLLRPREDEERQPLFVILKLTE